MNAAAAAAGRDALLRAETRVAIVANALMSVGFFFLVFGWRVVETSALAFDFLPQTFGVTFLGTLVPSILAYRRIARGQVVPARAPLSPLRHGLRLLGAALAAVVVLGGVAALLLPLLAPPSLPPLPALLLKAGYGSLVGVLMTPPLLRSLLGMPWRPRRAAATAR